MSSVYLPFCDTIAVRRNYRPRNGFTGRFKRQPLAVDFLSEVTPQRPFLTCKRTFYRLSYARWGIVSRSLYQNVCNMIRVVKEYSNTGLNRFLTLKTCVTPKSRWRKFSRLEIGSGPTRRPGWLTVDHCRGADVIWNLEHPLPFPDDCFETVYASHVLEHFRHAKLKLLLVELNRVLKAGGKILICVPDASKYVTAYVANDPMGLLRYQPAILSPCRMDILNYMFYMDGHHHMMFDIENLRWHTEHAGFRNCEERPFDSSIDSEERRYESLYAICEK